MDFSLQQVIQRIATATAGVTTAELAASPMGKWSVAEIVEHLLLTFTGTCRGMDKTLARGEPTRTRPTLQQRFAVLVVTKLGYFPKGRKSPEMVKPRGMAADQVLPAIRAAIIEMDEKLAACEQRFGKGKIADHPVLGPMTAIEWRRFHLVHTRHHMKQVEAMRVVAVELARAARASHIP